MISALVLAVVMFCGGAVTVTLTRGTTSGKGAAARTAAAAWMAQQVAPSAIVACDPQMCAVLQSKGIPASNLLVLGADNAGPLASDVIVSTAAVREEFGSRLTSVYAPVALATFGSGDAQVAVRVVAPDGSAAYLRSLQADAAARREAGALLLRNPDITDFGAPAAGASPGVPLRSADISVAPAFRGRDRSALDSVRTFLLAQQAPFRPADITTVRLASGQIALHVEFTAPSPLGLLGPPN